MIIFMTNIFIMGKLISKSTILFQYFLVIIISYSLKEILGRNNTRLEIHGIFVRGLIASLYQFSLPLSQDQMSPLILDCQGIDKNHPKGPHLETFPARVHLSTQNVTHASFTYLSLNCLSGTSTGSWWNKQEILGSAFIFKVLMRPIQETVMCFHPLRSPLMFQIGGP